MRAVCRKTKRKSPGDRSAWPVCIAWRQKDRGARFALDVAHVDGGAVKRVGPNRRTASTSPNPSETRSAAAVAAPRESSVCGSFLKSPVF